MVLSDYSNRQVLAGGTVDSRNSTVAIINKYQSLLRISVLALHKLISLRHLGSGITLEVLPPKCHGLQEQHG